MMHNAFAVVGSPFGMCTAFRQYEIVDASEEHHSMGMIYHTNHTKTVFHRYASEYEYYHKKDQ